MKVKLNPAIEGMSGQLGDLVFREVRGKTVVSRKPVVTAEPTENQTAHRERFKLAAAYGRSVMADNIARLLYESIAQSRGVPIFAVTIADYLNAPIIHNIDLSGYSRTVGNVIAVQATDDIEVVNVHVSIQDDQGNTLEAGNAVNESGRWLYTAQQTLSADTLSVKAIATDRPGGTTIKTETLQFQ